MNDKYFLSIHLPRLVGSSMHLDVNFKVSKVSKLQAGSTSGLHSIQQHSACEVNAVRTLSSTSCSQPASLALGSSLMMNTPVIGLHSIFNLPPGFPRSM